MGELCESKISTDQLVLQDCKPCLNYFVSQARTVRIGKISVVVTARYRLCKYPIGFGLGKHLYSLSLVPGEEVEIEVTRREKFTKEFHEDVSVEREFTRQFTATMREEFEKVSESNFEVTGEESAKVWKIGVESTQKYKEHEKEITKQFVELITKVTEKVNTKFEVAVDLKTEVENKFTSRRKVKNMNRCQTVTYNYFQLLRKYRADLILDDLRFDTLPDPKKPPRVLTASLRPILLQPVELIAARPTIVPGQFAVASQLRQAATVGAALGPVAMAQLAAVPDIPIAERLPLELTREDFLTKLEEELDKAEFEKFKKEFEEFLKGFEIGKPVRTHEYCVSTNGIYVDAMLGKCLACDQHDAEMRELEIEKLRLEVEKMRLELELAKKQAGPEEEGGDVE